MRVVSLVVLIAAVAAANADSTYFDLKDAPVLFDNFIKRFQRRYINEADRQIHYDAFVRNLEKINDMNAVSPETTYGITQFADFTEQEKAAHLGRRG